MNYRAERVAPNSKRHVPLTLHANLHQIHAGMWECSIDLNEELETYNSFLSPHLLSFLGYQLSAAARSSAFDDLITCPSSCDVDTQDFWGSGNVSNTDGTRNIIIK